MYNMHNLAFNVSMGAVYEVLVNYCQQITLNRPNCINVKCTNFLSGVQAFQQGTSFNEYLAIKVIYRLLYYSFMYYMFSSFMSFSLPSPSPPLLGIWPMTC